MMREYLHSRDWVSRWGSIDSTRASGLPESEMVPLAGLDARLFIALDTLPIDAFDSLPMAIFNSLLVVCFDPVPVATLYLPLLPGWEPGKTGLASCLP